MSKRPGDSGYPEGWCIHFRSMGHHDTCERDVNYSELAGGRAGSFSKLPCFIRVPDPHAATRVTCEHFRPPTGDEILVHEDWYAERLIVLRKVMEGIRPWRKAHQGRSAAEVVECPACSGRLHLSIAASNGHVHARCETEGCVSWME